MIIFLLKLTTELVPRKTETKARRLVGNTMNTH